MSLPPGGDAELITRDDLRRLEARLDARIQGVGSRVTEHDGRLAVLSERADHLDRRCDILSERIDIQFRRVDDRFDMVDARLDRVEDLIGEVRGEFRAGRRHQTKMTMLGVAGSTFTTAALCVGTLVVRF
jgi:hypothetical protein